MLRLAKKKAKAEAKKRELEAAQNVEEERLLAKHKVYSTAIGAGLTPLLTAWPKRVLPRERKLVLCLCGEGCCIS